MAAAIVELDALADAVRSTAKNDDLLPVGRRCLVRGLAGERPLVSRIHVGGGRGEFCRAGVDALEYRPHIERAAAFAHIVGGKTRQLAEPRIREAHGFQAAERFRCRGQPLLAYLLFGVDNATDLREEPRIDLAGGVNVRI